MRMRKAALGAVLIFHASPTFAYFDEGVYAPQPRSVAAFSVGARHIEMLAVTQRARADTQLRQKYLEECRSMNKVFPGYPQPAIVSVDFRVKF